jgi:hypothetical protein
VGVLTAFTAAGCNSDPTTTPTTPTTPTAVTETFSGTLTVNGAVTFPFVANQAGSANATIKALQPDAVVTTGAGAGGFTVGETVYQGPSLAEATWSAVVSGWNPSANALAVRSLVGTLTVDGEVVGADSGTRRSGTAITATVIGIALGTWSGTTCSIVLANDVSGLGSAVTGAVQGAGSLCARVYDVGKLTGAATFTIEVSHF